jgi:hypothetical protein
MLFIFFFHFSFFVFFFKYLNIILCFLFNIFFFLCFLFNIYFFFSEEFFFKIYVIAINDCFFFGGDNNPNAFDLDDG